jgi:hypothetical protein
METTFSHDEKLFHGVMEVLNRIPREELEAVLTSGSCDWTHAFRVMENMSSRRSLLNAFHSVASFLPDHAKI